jgi:hypothetical protein
MNLFIPFAAVQLLSFESCDNTEIREIIYSGIES